MNLRITVEPNSVVEVEKGQTIGKAISVSFGKNDRSILGALVNNRVKELSAPLSKDSSIIPIKLNSIDGMRIYQRTATFILLKALHEISPESKASILHPLSDGLYIELTGPFKLDKVFIQRLEARMHELVEKDLALIRKKVPKNEAIELLEKMGQDAQARLVHTRKCKTLSIYELDGFKSFFLGYLAPSTGCIYSFKLVLHSTGVVLHLPTMMNAEATAKEPHVHNLVDVLKESIKWRKILDIDDVGMLNALVEKGKHQDFILLAEVLHEKRITYIADRISSNKKIKVVLLAGPSASGKTTFTKRLSLQLRVNGLRPIQVSMDDFFLDRKFTPRTPSGDYDFESPLALDVNLFSKSIQDIIDKKQVYLPKFDFKEGHSFLSNEPVVPENKTIVMIEGIHALNPLFSKSLKAENLFKIYVSPLSELPLDSHNWIQNADTRLLRRILRDHQFRNYSAIDTINRWPAVRMGESQHILPFQEEANVYFNTALLYEFSVIRSQIEPLLGQINEEHPAFAEAVRLNAFLSYFAPIPVNLIPSHSILREFIGGSSFD